MQNVVVGYSDYLQATLLKKNRSLVVCITSTHVRQTIQLHHQFGLRTIKIRDERADHVLTPELKTPKEAILSIRITSAWIRLD